MGKLTTAQQRLINSLSEGKKVKSPYSKTANALRQLGLVKYAMFVGWFLTPMGTTYVKGEHRD